jgi:hypothetical protein
MPPGESRPFNSNLDNLKSPGEAGVSLQFEILFLLQETNLTETSKAFQLSADLVDQSTGKVVSIFSRTSLSGPPPCFSHCTHLFCLVYCLHPFTIYVLPTPSN